MTADPTTLWTAANGLATLLAEAAAAIPWTRNDGTAVPACVTPVEPAVECDTLHVWPGIIQTIHQGSCIAAPQADLNYRIATCIGAGTNENCAWWREGDRSQNAINRLWGVYGYLVASYLNGALKTALDGVSCEDIRFQPVNNVPSADYAVWQGSIRVNLGVVDLAS